MVAPLVIYGAIAAGGVVTGLLGAWGISKLCEDDAERLRKMEKDYETKKAEAEIQKKHAKNQAELMEAKLAEAKAQLDYMKIVEQTNLARLRAAQYERDAIALEKANKGK